MKEFNGKLDICVPCAGINRNLGFLDTSFEEHQKLIGVNVMGVYHTAQLAAKQMIANETKKGSIVLVASIASYMSIRSQMSSAYCGTKGAVRAMCPAIAAELVKYVSLHLSFCQTHRFIEFLARVFESTRFHLDM